MSAPVLYLGDASRQTAAAYLGGVMERAGIAFDYVPSDQPAGTGALAGDWRLVVLSDYPAANLGAEAMGRLCEEVRGGRGLLMIGGWDSFQGLHGGYAGTPVAATLPVEIASCDDRCNVPFPCLVVARRPADHPILAGLPWDRPPAIGGYNRLGLKPRAQLLLEVVRYATSRKARGGVSFREQGRDPLLAVWEFGSGRTGAFASDAAPHWVGGFVDWGGQRLRAGSAGCEVEVGAHYARFFENLIRWCGRL